MKNSLIFSLLLIFFSTAMLAQNENRLCGTNDISPWFVEYISQPDKYDNSLREEVVYLPLTVHILGTDEGTGYFRRSQLYDALCRLNEDFAATNLQFFVKGEIRYHDNTRWYDHEEYRDGYDMMRSNNVSGTINSYIVQNPAGNCGYFAPVGDAVALSKSCMAPNDHTWAHELGHYFSLPHPFVGWEGIDYDPAVPTSSYRSQNRRNIENVARDNCNRAADRFCDTPPDYLSYRWPCDNQGFSTVTQTDLNGETFKSDGTLFMSYASDRCQSRFSTGQINAMVANLNAQRPYLINNETYAGDIMENPMFVSPADDGVVDADNGELIWTTVENATHYHVQASRLPNLGGLLIINEVVTDTSIFLPELVIGRTYYWRVRAFNAFEFCTNPSQRYSFTAAELTSTEEIKSDEINIWPNPLSSTSALIFFEGTPELEHTELIWRIVDLDGQLVDQGKTGNNNNLSLTNTLTPGVYNLILEFEGSRIVRPLVITR